MLGLNQLCGFGVGGVAGASYVGMSNTTSDPTNINAANKQITFTVNPIVGDVILVQTVAGQYDSGNGVTSSGYTSISNYVDVGGYAHKSYYRVSTGTETSIDYFGLDSSAVIIRGTSYLGAGSWGDGGASGTTSVTPSGSTTSTDVVVVLAATRSPGPMAAPAGFTKAASTKSTYFESAHFYKLADNSTSALSITNAGVFGDAAIAITLRPIP